MIKKNFSARVLKVEKKKQSRLELHRAIKLLRTFQSQQIEGNLVHTDVSDGTVIVKIQTTVGNVRRAKQYSKHYSQRTESSSASFIDQSVKDTERAIRTLKRTPSEEVSEFYKRLAAQK